jgi:hypothetical protein
MHHPERAKECAQSNPRAGAQQGGQNDKGVHLRQAEERFRVQPLPHMTSRRQTRRKGSPLASAQSEAAPRWHSRLPVSPGIDSMDDPGEKASEAGAALEIHAFAGQVPGILYAVPSWLRNNRTARRHPCCAGRPVNNRRPVRARDVTNSMTVRHHRRATPDGPNAPP